MSANAFSPLARGKPRLLIVTTIPHTFWFLFPFAEHFRRLGWTVDALTGSLEPFRERGHFDQAFGVEWSRHPLDFHNVLRAPARVREVVAARRYDVVHVHTPVAAFVTRFALRDRWSQKGPCVVYTAHGFHFHPAGSPVNNATFLALEKLAGRWTDYLVVINREDLAAARRHRLVPPERIRWMPGIGVDLNHYSPERVPPDEVRAFREANGLGDDPCVLVVGELIPRKRHADAIRAFSAVALDPAVLRAHLLLAGRGPLEKGLRGEVHHRGLQARVHFLGSRNDVPLLMAAAQLLVLASDREGLPRCVLEAMSMGLPVIGTRIRGTSELLEDGAGFAYEAGDVRALADLLRRLLASPETAQRAARVARQRVSSYRLGNVIALHEQLYADALAWPTATPGP